MNFVRLRAVVYVMLLAVAFSCDKDDPTPPYVINGSVKPVDFLTESKYTTLNIEVAYVEGFQPQPTSLNILLSFLQERINKSGGVTITQRSIPATGRVSIDIDVIREIEKANRKTVTGGNTLTAWIMFLDAEYSASTDTEKVLGVAYGASSLAVFEQSVHNYTRPDMPARWALETFILTHETGHMLGLVNNGTPMKSLHQDTEHGAHCTNTKCLMYWEAQNNLNLADLLGENNIPVLDDACLADLKAAGGK